MTDTQTMRAEFETWAKANNGCTARLKGTDQYIGTSEQAAWKAWQAAWTRKPAAQVAGAVYEYKVRDGSWMECSKVFYGTAESYGYLTRILYAHPAPEPDATKVVSVPVPWEKARVDDPNEMATVNIMRFMEAEIAEWRALAADRERT